MTSPEPTVSTRRDGFLLQAIFAVGILAFVGGIYVLSSTTLGTAVQPALAAVARELPSTVGPAIAVAAVSALSIAAGAVLIRAVAGEPFEGWAQAILAGLAGAVLLDTALMAALGAVGLFRWPLLLIVNVAAVGAGVLVRPILAPGRMRRPSLPALGPVGWLFAALVWCPPILLQLASPVVPSNDIGPNHIAPVEHLRIFGALSALDLTVSPVYGPTRIFLGYQGLLGNIATITNIEAGTAIAAFILPLAVLLSVGGCAVAGSIHGRRAAGFALLLVAMTVPFLRLTDARATVVAIPLALLTLWLLLTPLGATAFRRSAVLALVLCATIYIHPLIGLISVAVVVLAAIVWPERYAAQGVPAALAAFIGAAPQWAAMLGVSFASVLALVAIPVAAGVVYVLTRRPLSWRISRRVLTALGAVALLIAIALALIPDPSRAGAMVVTVTSLTTDFAVLLLAAATAYVAMLVAHERGTTWAGVTLLTVGVLAGAIAAWSATAVTAVVGSVAALDYEVTKTTMYLAPTLLALIGAIGLAVVWARTEWVTMVRVGILAIIIVLAAAPIRPGLVDELSLGEHRLSETAAISLRIAKNGYWLSFPDVRWVIDSRQRQVVEFLRHEIAAGRLSETDDVLQVAESWRSDAGPSYAMSLSASAGVVESIAANDGPRSADTVGGRMLELGNLDQILDGDYPYVVVQTRGLQPDVLPKLKAHGYESIFSNGVAQVLRRST